MKYALCVRARGVCGKLSPGRGELPSVPRVSVRPWRSEAEVGVLQDLERFLQRLRSQDSRRTAQALRDGVFPPGTRRRDAQKAER